MKVYLFGTEWCGPCKNQEKIIKELSNEYEFEYTKYEIGEDPALNTIVDNTMILYKVKIVPMVIIIDNNSDKEIYRSIGFVSKEKLKKVLEKEGIRKVT